MRTKVLGGSLLLTVIALTGCSTGASSTGAAVGAAAGGATAAVAAAGQSAAVGSVAAGSYVFLPKSLNNPYWVDARKGMEAEATKLGVKAQFLGPDTDDAGK